VNIVSLMAILSIGLTGSVLAQEQPQSDVLPTSAGDLEMTFIGHGSLMFTFNGKVIHVDPWSRQADYAKLPKADLIMITHEHPDHFDLAAIKTIRSTNTLVVLTAACSEDVRGSLVMKNGEAKTVMGIRIEAVPAYNLVHKRADGTPYHQKGVGNGYIFTFGDKRIYVAGDTENTPEMKALKGIDVAFLPMNLPYTMIPEMVADAAKVFMPKILYPYHYGDTDPRKLVEMLKATPQIDVRIRKLK